MVLLLGGVNRNLLTILAQTLEANHTVGLGEQGVVGATAHVGTGVDVRATLANQNVAGQNVLTIRTLGTQALGCSAYFSTILSVRVEKRRAVSLP